MSIRLWLMVADCWLCGTSIELTEEQEQEALRLLREIDGSGATGVSPVPADRLGATGVSPVPVKEKHGQDARGTRPITPIVQAPRRVAAARAHRGTRARVRDLYEKGPAGVFWGEVFRNLPAWLISLVLHAMTLLLLGLWMHHPPQEPLAIFLSTAVSYQDLLGEEGTPKEPPPEAFEFDDPGSIDVTHMETEAKSIGKEEVELTNLEIDVPDPAGDFPNPTARSMIPLPPSAVGNMLAGRDPALRANLVRREGGTSFTEAAVARGLKWITRHQNANGSWSLHAFGRAPGCRGKCNGEGSVRSDTAGTALALLPMLGAGQTHVSGQYTDAVLGGLTWLVRQQRDNGDLRGRGGGRMYAHGLAAIVLCEAYALTGDEQLRGPARSAMDFIVRAQHPRGGWRYDPGQAADTSVVGWQLMALRSGQMAYLHVPPKTYELTEQYLDRAATDRLGALYPYMPGHGPTEVMTAEALLCRQYLGWPKEHPGLQAGAKYLMQHKPNTSRPNVYYWYYATQVLHHLGGKPWREWNSRMRTVLCNMQEKTGHAAGSWAPRGRFARQGGRLYMTSLAVCTLEVYYRHLPLYREDVLEGF
jgi:hypothetical protein